MKKIILILSLLFSLAACEVRASDTLRIAGGMLKWTNGSATGGVWLSPFITIEATSAGYININNGTRAYPIKYSNIKYPSSTSIRDLQSTLRKMCDSARLYIAQSSSAYRSDTALFGTTATSVTTLPVVIDKIIIAGTGTTCFYYLYDGAGTLIEPFSTASLVTYNLGLYISSGFKVAMKGTTTGKVLVVYHIAQQGTY